MKNTVMKTLIFNKQVRFYYIDNTSLISQIIDRKKPISGVLRQALGTTVSIVSLLSATLKESHRISLQLSMSNREHKLYADTDAQGHVRGYLNKALQELNQEALASTPLETLIGPKAAIRLIHGTPMHSYTGITDMPYQNIVDDLSHYFLQSEQTATHISVSLEFDENQDVKHSQALYAQLLPGAQPALLEEVNRRIQQKPTFFQELRDLHKESFAQKLEETFEDLTVIGSQPVQFYCGCSKEMFYGMFHSLHASELKQAVRQQEGLEAVCHICGQEYHFTSGEIQSLI